jgi:flotillin
MDSSLAVAGGTLLAVSVLVPFAVAGFLRNVEAGDIRLVSWLNGRLHIYRGPCKALVVPIFTVSRTIPAQAINVDIEITDQTADIDAEGNSAPVKVTVQASAIVSVSESDAMVNTAANKFFSKPEGEQLSILTDVLSSAGRRAVNLLKHDQLFSIRAERSLEDDELAVIIKEACSRELMDLGLSFNSLNIKAVLSEVAEARRRESAARAKASAEVVQAQESQRARVAQLEAEQKVNDQERVLQVQVAANGACVARAEAQRLQVAQLQKRAELEATLLTQARAQAEQQVIEREAQGRAEAARIRAVAAAEADAIRAKASALANAGAGYLDLKRLELAPELADKVAAALKDAEFVNFGAGAEGAIAGGSSDVLKVVQTLMAARVVNAKGA